MAVSRASVWGFGGLVAGFALAMTLRRDPPPPAPADCPPPPLTAARVEARRDARPPSTPPDTDAEPDRPTVVATGSLLPPGAEPDPEEPPVPWPDDVPPNARPEAVAPQLEEVARACWGDAFVDVDCSEPPCFVVVDVAEGESPSPFTCPAWQERWPGGIGKTGTSGLCPDGREVSTLMFSPGIDGTPDRARDPDDPFAGIRRMTTRAAAWQARTGCSAPVQLTVDNRPGYHLAWEPDQ